MNYEHLADSWIQGYLVHKIRLGALGWSNVETNLLESEFLDISAQLFSSSQIMGLRADQSHICAPLAWEVVSALMIDESSITMSLLQTS
jgi:hypothetical protein